MIKLISKIKLTNKIVRLLCKQNEVKHTIDESFIKKIQMEATKVDIIDNTNCNDNITITEEIDDTTVENISEPVNNKSNNNNNKKTIIFEDINFITPEVISTKFGELLLTRNKITKNTNTIHYVTTSISSRYIKRLFLHSRNSLILFGRYYNFKMLNQIYESLKKFINERYYGKPNKIKNPFKKCKNNKDIYHLHRKITKEQINFLDNFGVIVDSEFNLLLDKIDGNYLKYDIKELLVNYELNMNKNNMPKYKKFNYFLSFRELKNIIAYKNYEKKGVTFNILNNRKIYFYKNCFPPTMIQLYALFDKVIKENLYFLNHKKNFIDIGCGSGILGFITLNNLKNIEYFLGIDISNDAIKSSISNRNNLEYNDKIQFEKIDINDIVNDSSKYDCIKDNKFDVIISNPPFINSSAINTDNLGVNDEDYKFIDKIFEFSNSNLNKNGNIILIYSDFGEIMGLNEPNKIEKLCEKYGLIIKSKNEASFVNEEKEENKLFGNYNSNMDPLLDFKKKSKLIIYNLFKPNN